MPDNKALVKQGIFAAATVLMITNLVSRILGFVRDQIMTATFGLSADVDAYIAAFTIPDFLYSLLVGGALGAAFIPVFRTYLSTDKAEEAWEVASTMINLVLIFMTIGIILGMIYTPYLIPLVAHGLKGETLEKTIMLTRIMFPAVLFTGLNGIQMGILQSYKHFLAPSLGAIFYNVSIITVGILLSQHFGIAAFSIGVVFGIIGNFIIQYFTLKKIGIKYRPVINLKHPGVRKLGLLVIPAIIGLSANHINLIVNQNLASTLAEGSIAALRLANRLMMLPFAVFATSIALAVFPTLTEKAAKAEFKDFKDTLSLGIRSIAFLTVPAALAFMALGVPIIRLLFQQGQFMPEDTVLTASILFYYSLTLLAMGSAGVLTRSFYSLQNTIIPVSISVATIFINYSLNKALIGPMGAPGLALAFSITSYIYMSALFFMLRRKVGPLGAKRMSITFAQVTLAGLIAVAVGYGVSIGIESVLGVEKKLTQLIQVTLSLASVGVVYGSVTLLMGMEEAKQFLNRLKGWDFGKHGEGYLRMSYANSEENLKEAMHRIKKYIER